jgi:hypothetical protein
MLICAKLRHDMQICVHRQVQLVGAAGLLNVATVYTACIQAFASFAEGWREGR